MQCFFLCGDESSFVDGIARWRMALNINLCEFSFFNFGCLCDSFLFALFFRVVVFFVMGEMDFVRIVSC